MREPNNKVDSNAGAVVSKYSRKNVMHRKSAQNVKYLEQMSSKVCLHTNEMSADFQVIGHEPKLMAIWLTKFLKRTTNSGKAVIKGKRVNRGGAYGLEVLVNIIS